MFTLTTRKPRKEAKRKDAHFHRCSLWENKRNWCQTWPRYLYYRGCLSWIWTRVTVWHLIMSTNQNPANRGLKHWQVSVSWRHSTTLHFITKTRKLQVFTDLETWHRELETVSRFARKMVGDFSRWLVRRGLGPLRDRGTFPPPSASPLSDILIVLECDSCAVLGCSLSSKYPMQEVPTV